MLRSRRKSALQSPGGTARGRETRGIGSPVEVVVERRPGSRDGRRQVKSPADEKRKSSRDDTQPREWQVCSAEDQPRCRKAIRYGRARPGSMGRRKLSHESSEPSDRARATAGVTRCGQQRGPISRPRGLGVKRAALIGRSAKTGCGLQCSEALGIA